VCAAGGRDLGLVRGWGTPGTGPNVGPPVRGTGRGSRARS
jgi:hypothetical protein